MHPQRDHGGSMQFDRALIIQDVWCDSILGGEKSWEMRTTRTNVRGTIGLIKAGTGFIQGSVELNDSLDAIPEKEYYQHIGKHHIRRLPDAAQKWEYPWVMKNPIRFEEPIPYSHPSGAVIWVRMPAAIGV